MSQSASVIRQCIMAAVVAVLAGCDRIPCEVAPAFPYCVGEVRQEYGKPPVKWNRKPTCTRKAGTISCVK